MTALAEELAEQERWPLLAPAETGREYERLVRNEFVSPEKMHEWAGGKLLALLRYARDNVPYYRDMFARLGAAPEDAGSLDTLAALPLLTKREVYENEARLQPAAARRDDPVVGLTTTSGTTGRPTRILQNLANMRMYPLLKQREFRWFRFDPAGKLATIRLASQLPQREGKGLADGESLQALAWQYMEGNFKTGPFVAFAVTNPVERQLEWLRRERPDYLMAYSETLEHLALASGDAVPAPSLRALFAISEQLTASMRRRIESRFGVPIRQNYGLNEIGLVAAKCEAGRYHVHSEHCVVEIVDDEARPCPAGGTGRIVVTALRNTAMPLIRYDTDDMAEVLAGPCPCGRTLPSFGEVSGRYSRIAYLPEGTLGFVGAVRGALEDMPAALSRDLRQFQVHQFRDNRFELRLAVAAPLPAAFGERIQAAWAAAGNSIPLSIVELPSIPRGRGGKFQDFTSDFMPAPDGA